MDASLKWCFNTSTVAHRGRWGASTPSEPAVQEVYAAAAFQDAPYAVVVTNSIFTKSAHQLAHKNGVLLMHHTELAGLENRLNRLECDTT